MCVCMHVMRHSVGTIAFLLGDIVCEIGHELQEYERKKKQTEQRHIRDGKRIQTKSILCNMFLEDEKRMKKKTQHNKLKT